MSKYFGPISEGWNFEDETAEGYGKIGIMTFANAVQTWSLMQGGRATSVAEAALAFNCEAEMIVEAVEEHYWLFLEGDRNDYAKLIIEHEGE